MRRYLHAVRACLRHPWRTCIASAVFFGFSLWLASLLPSTFMDVGDEALSIVTIAAPPGSTLTDTLALNEGAYERLRDMPERSEENTSELQSLLRHSYAVFCLK